MELEIIRAVQSLANPVLDVLMQGITILGEPVCTLLLFAALYWSIDKEKGQRFAYGVILSLLCNCAVKDVVRAPRPIGQPGVRSLRVETATGSSFPSGHTQNAAAVATALLQLSRRPARYLLLLYPLLVGFSRIYLGVHYPRDVLAALPLGAAAVLAAGWLWRCFGRHRLGLYVFTAALFLPLLLWRGTMDYYKAIGCLCGLIAAVPFERRYVRFTTEGLPGWRRFWRWQAGVLLLGAFYGLLKALLPAGPMFSLLRYGLLVFAALALYPLAFTHLEGRAGKGG